MGVVGVNKMGTKHAAITLTLFRALRHSARRLDQQCSRRQLSVPEEMRKFVWPIPPAASAASATVELSRQFQLHKAYSAPEDMDDLHTLGFTALQQVDKRLHQLGSPEWTPKPQIVQLSVGQVVRHKKYDYRGVVVGWHEQCEESEEWQRAMGVHRLKDGPKQPFYEVLVDERDRPNSQQCYAAQENLTNIDPQQDGVACEPVQNDMVEAYLQQFLPLEARYVPGEELIDKFPEM